MHKFERPLVERLVRKLVTSTTKRIVAMTGPRQTGKTTIAIQACGRLRKHGYQCLFAALDQSPSHHVPGLNINEVVPTGVAPDVHWVIELWTRAREIAARHTGGTVLILDEIQNISNWSGVVKGLWDADRRVGNRLQVVILGSAPWRLLTGMREALTGRFDLLRVTHWSLREMSQAFDLTSDEFLFYGGYPGTMSERASQIRLDGWHKYVEDSIVGPTIDADIVALTRIRKPALMRQLMELAPHYSGQLMSLTKLLGQLQDAGNKATIAGYLDLLSDAGLVHGLARYSPAPHVGRAAPRKLNVLNTALITTHSGYSLEEAKSDRTYWGRIVESAIGAHLLNSLPTAARLFYWRMPPHEVDFVMQSGPNVIGIEVKSGRARRLSGLTAFRERFPHARTAIVGSGGIPVNEFLSIDAKEWLITL